MRMFVIGWLALASLAGHHARAEVDPARPITIIVPYAPGGNTDVAARMIAEEMGRSLNQSVIVQNKLGAGTTPNL